MRLFVLWGLVLGRLVLGWLVLGGLGSVRRAVGCGGDPLDLSMGWSRFPFGMGHLLVLGNCDVLLLRRRVVLRNGDGVLLLDGFGDSRIVGLGRLGDGVIGGLGFGDQMGADGGLSHRRRLDIGGGGWDGHGFGLLHDACVILGDSGGLVDSVRLGVGARLMLDLGGGLGVSVGDCVLLNDGVVLRHSVVFDHHALFDDGADIGVCLMLDDSRWLDDGVSRGDVLVLVDGRGLELGIGLRLRLVVGLGLGVVVGRV